MAHGIGRIIVVLSLQFEGGRGLAEVGGRGLYIYMYVYVL